MSIVIPTKAPQLKDDGTAGSPLPSARLHQMPCWINYNGPAEVDQFFQIQGKYVPAYAAESSAEEDQSLTKEPPAYPVSKSIYLSGFRGRLLQGRRSSVPKGFQGYVLTARQVDQLYAPHPDVPPQPIERTVLMATRKFGGFMVWDHDHPPHPAGDTTLKAMDWLMVASLIHKPTSVP
ncbi:hypothetical protein H4R33_001330 [Dimargaris cristalligena]|uniref:Ribonuclease H2, subunit C n=1 Tax=Dimargaris cristalligena TaxID=215637 RepID=A0A4P9ZS35_9FUNG|nr:hypothetical protein H4R33_001330 [Dimargaris cristalligena]RKP36344.1 ribonuclease H2, subunit C [Dimargaris cristalligena]|eukprot:RKP36344.1 ribonuclease H2, subunit C [Dimargaris cristalligena]